MPLKPLFMELSQIGQAFPANGFNRMPSGFAGFVFSFFFLAALCGLFWALVFNKSLRTKFERGALEFHRVEKQEDKDSYDALMLAGAIIGALVFTTVLVSLLIFVIVREL
jgi:hypothetical protein